MAKKISKAHESCRQMLADANRRNDVLTTALQFLVRGDGVKVKGKAGYSAIVMGPTRADGGVVVETWVPPDKSSRPYSQAFYLEEWLSKGERYHANLNDELSTGYRDLVERVRHVRAVALETPVVHRG